MKLKITVQGVAYEVGVEILEFGDDVPAPRAPLPLPAQRRATGTPAAAAPPPTNRVSPDGGPGSVNSPLAGTVAEVRCAVGDAVTKDQVLLVVEAMKMHTSIASPLAGTVTAVKVSAGDSVRENQPLVEIE